MEFNLAFDGPFRKAYLVFSHFLIQSCVVNAKECCGVPLIAVESVQHLDQYGPLQGIHEILQVDIFFYVEIIDEKMKKDLIEFLLLHLCSMRKTPWIIFEESKDLLL